MVRRVTVTVDLKYLMFEKDFDLIASFEIENIVIQLLKKDKLAHLLRQLCKSNRGNVSKMVVIKIISVGLIICATFINEKDFL